MHFSFPPFYIEKNSNFLKESKFIHILLTKIESHLFKYISFKIHSLKMKIESNIIHPHGWPKWDQWPKTCGIKGGNDEAISVAQHLSIGQAAKG